MSEQKKITRNLIKNTCINFIIFTCILLAFDFMIYNKISYSLYKNVDEQLESSKQRFSKSSKINKPDVEINTDKTRSEFEKAPEDIENIKDINPRLITIIRNQNGETTNENDLGSLSDYSDQIKFNKENLNNIYNIQLNGEYKYRCINFESVKDNETIYVQILVNIDGETITLENILNVLILGTAILAVASMLLSYVLSKRTMKPVIEAYKKQTEFVQNASHELRTPLTIIQAKQELLLKEPDKKILDKSEDINLTLKETRRLTKLIKELMDLARADSNNYELKKEELDINELIAEISTPYKDIAQMQGKEVILDLNYDKKIQLNKNKINELLVIVLDNAIKYTNKNDKITIKTYSREGKCNIEIQDTGTGISNECLKHMFDRFYREDKARSRETGGMGLGLSIAKTIVNMHNGSIKALHNLPKGTVILIKF